MPAWSWRPGSTTCGDSTSSNLNDTATSSPYLSQNRKTIIDNSDYLVWVLSGILMLEYVTLALLFGPVNANATLGFRLIACFIALLIISSHLGSFDIRPKRWTPLFGRRVPKEDQPPY